MMMTLLYCLAALPSMSASSSRFLKALSGELVAMETIVLVAVDSGSGVFWWMNPPKPGSDLEIK